MNMVLKCLVNVTGHHQSMNCCKKKKKKKAGLTL